MAKPPTLQLIRSRRNESIKPGNVEIYCGAETSRPPFPVDVQIIEEDTWQVLSAGNIARDIDEHPIRLMTSLIDQKPLPVGEVVVKDSRWQAVVVDFDQDPVCQWDWLVKAYQQVIGQAICNHTGVISMPLLGVRHGCIDIKESLKLLTDSIKLQHEADFPRIWLNVREEDVNVVNLLLADSTCNN